MDLSEKGKKRLGKNERVEMLFQDSNTDQLVFDTKQIVSWVSRFFPLLPGDVILTGTPPGVGVFMKPAPKFLKVIPKSFLL